MSTHTSTGRFVAHEKGDKPPSIKGRRPVISSVEMFLWRNYLIFVSCTAPPSTSLNASLMSTGTSDRSVVSGVCVVQCFMQRVGCSNYYVQVVTKLIRNVHAEVLLYT